MYRPCPFDLQAGNSQREVVHHHKDALISMLYYVCLQIISFCFVFVSQFFAELRPLLEATGKISQIRAALDAKVPVLTIVFGGVEVPFFTSEECALPS